MFLFLQEYCKFKNMEDGAFPSVYIGLKDKLSGIHKVITDSTAHLIQLLQSYKEKLREFSKDGETPGLVTSLEGLAGKAGVREGEQNRDFFSKHPQMLPICPCEGSLDINKFTL